MVLGMTRPTHRKESTFLLYRRRVPAEVQRIAAGRKIGIRLPGDEIGNVGVLITVTVGSEIKFSLRTRDPAVAKIRTSAITEQLERTWEAIRYGPRELTYKQVVALSGLLYKAFAEALEEEPGSASLWHAVIETNKAAESGRHGLRANLGVFESDADRIMASLDERFGDLVDSTLLREGVIVDDVSRSRLLQEAGTALTEAAQKLHRNATGDYRPDSNAARFPKPEAVTNNASTKPGESLTALFEGWRVEATAGQMAARTISDYESRFRIFRKFIGHDVAERVSIEDVIRFKDHRLKEVSDRTVRNSDLVALKSVFEWGVANRKLQSNPARGVTLKVRKKRLERTKGFTLDEATAILKAARSYEGGEREFSKTVAAKRWTPWLCAYTGARVGEIVQLRKEDVHQREGAWGIHITPEAGTVKTNEARFVPLHKHLIEIGFLRLVENAAEGPLFVNPQLNGDVLKPAGGVKNRVREFVRTIVSDPRVQPNHAWRHLFKTLGRQGGIEHATLDAICGHAPSSVGASYGDRTVKETAAAIARFPRYSVDE